MIINELIAFARTDAELADWLAESKWNVRTAINFEPDRGSSQDMVETYLRLYRMAKAMQEQETPVEATQETEEYVLNVASGDAYFSSRG